MDARSLQRSTCKCMRRPMTVNTGALVVQTHSASVNDILALPWDKGSTVTIIGGKEPVSLIKAVCNRPPRWPSGWGVRLESGRSQCSNPACGGIFPVSSHTSDLKIGTPVATLPGAWLYMVSIGTGCSGVSILWLGEMESRICNVYLSVAARDIVWADLSLRYTRMLLGR